MGKFLKGLLIVILCIGVFGSIVYFGLRLLARFHIFNISEISYETNTYTLDPSFKDISIDVNTTDIVFEKATDGKCTVRCYETDKVKHKVEVVNGKLSITVQDTRKWYDYIISIFNNLKLTISLPDSIYGSLEIENDTGKIELPQETTFAGVTVKCDTGNIEARGISVIGTADLETATGAIRIEELRCHDLEVSTNTGRISMKDVQASGLMDIESDTGNIEFKKCDAREIEIKTDTGNVTGTLLTAKTFKTDSTTGKITVPDTTGEGTCTVKTATGNINIDILD